MKVQPINLRTLARGQRCMLRISPECDVSGERTALCHIRMDLVAGIAQKPPDTCAVWGCHACHDMIDGRSTVLASAPDSLEAIILSALLRQLAEYENLNIAMARQEGWA